MFQFRENFKLYEKDFCNFHLHSNQTIWEIKLLISKEQKKQRMCSHFKFLSMLYIIWVKLLYSNLAQRDKINSAPVRCYIKNKTQSFIVLNLQ